MSRPQSDAAPTRVSRRQFNKATAASTLFSTFAISGTKASGRIIGANDRVRHGVVGINGQGHHHTKSFASMGDVDVTYLVDPDSRLFESRSKTVQDAGGNTPRCVQDVRQALEDPDLDTISIATCNHAHSLIAIWACQAGKDVYVEKPLSHNIYEGRKVVEAAEKYDRVVQHGTQQRTQESRGRTMAAIHSGKYGKLLVSKGYCCKPRWSIGKKPHAAPPSELDFNVWLGPAEEQPYHENLVHYNWHWFWDFGNGDLGNQGVHQTDVARWAIKDGTMPNRVWSLGGRFGYDDQGETPNTILSICEYGDVILLMETRGLVGKHDGFPRIVENDFFTTEGRIRGTTFYPNSGAEPEPVKFDGSHGVAPGGQFGSFIRAVRSRKPEDNNANAEVGHYSSAVCHFGNISYRLGEDVPFRIRKPEGVLGDNPQVTDSLQYTLENIRAVGTNFDEDTYRLGAILEFDPQTERFVSEPLTQSEAKRDAANALLTRSYRPPFVVPESV